MNTEQQNMIQYAFQALTDQLDLKTEILEMVINSGYLVVQIDQTVLEYRFYIPDKSSTIALNMLKNQNDDHPLLYISTHIKPEMAKALHKFDIQYLDMSGNAWLKKGPVLILLKGNKPERQTLKPKTIRAFKPAGIKMIFALLNELNLVNATYREIADTAGIALGNVGDLMNDLETLGYLFNMGKKGKKLQNHKMLLDRWCIAYMENLRPKLFLGTFSGPRKNWQDINLSPLHAQWGGEPGAAILDQYLKPEILTVYVEPEHPEKFILPNKLYKDNQGNINLIKRFWLQKDQLDYVPPILIYAELMASNEQRNTEAAKRIYEKHIVRHFANN